MAGDVTEGTVAEWQSKRLSEEAGAEGHQRRGWLSARFRLRRKKALKVKVKNQVAKVFSAEEKTAMLAAAKTARAPSIYPALTLALNAGMRDAEMGGRG